MEYNLEVIDNKMKLYNLIEHKEELINKIVKRNIGETYELLRQKTEWEQNIGGGALLFIAKTEKKEKIFIKVKHKSMTVESKLEEEQKFSMIPSLQNEFNIITKLQSKNLPHIIFFDEEEDIQVLGTEFINDSLAEKLDKSTIAEQLTIWKDLIEAVKNLYENNIVHSDIHEYNIRCRGNQPVLIDLEEARVLQQKVIFEESLDYIGRNNDSVLGNFPAESVNNAIKGINSLTRLKEFFKRYILADIEELVKQCNYDSNSGICTAIDHGEDKRIYQSINTSKLKIEGQRNNKDNRAKLVARIIKYLWHNDKLMHVDIGSNNGDFNRNICKLKNIAVSIGLEGCEKFNELARAIAFLEDLNNIEYFNFICGQDDLIKIIDNNKCVITVFSVYHHISNKDKFLGELGKLNCEAIILEMAIQEECYFRKNWQEEINYISSKTNLTNIFNVTRTKDYGRPIVLLTKKKLSKKNEMILKILANIF